MIRVFIGAPAAGLDAELEMVVADSLLSRATEAVQIHWMRTNDKPASFWHGWDLSACVTPFTPYRMGIPYYCRFEGRAIYLDCDMIVLDDIADLWNIELPDGKVLAARGKGSWRLDVMLIDCERIQPHMLPLDQLKKRDGFHRQNHYFARRPELIHSLGPAWNYLDHEDSGPLTGAKIVHLTHLPTQPHRRMAMKRLAAEGRRHWYKGATIPHPRRDIQELFDREYAAAIAAGHKPEDYYNDDE